MLLIKPFLLLSRLQKNGLGDRNYRTVSERRIASFVLAEPQQQFRSNFAWSRIASQRTHLRAARFVAN